MLLQGVFVPVPCPFYRDGRSYVRKLEHNMGRYSLGPVAGLVALPPGGEASGLTDAEAVEHLQTVGEFALKTKVLLAGVERASVSAACAMAEAAERAGFDAIVVGPPTDWARLVRGDDARELVLFYEAVADRSPLPVVLWSDARPPWLQLPGAMVTHLARHPNVIGLVDASLDVQRAQELLTETREIGRQVLVTTTFEAVTRRMLQVRPAETSASQGMVSVQALTAGTALASATAVAGPPAAVLKTRNRDVSFQILSAGPANGITALLHAGVAGAMPSLAACAPQACFEAYAAWKDGDLALANERAARLAEADAVLQRLGPAAVKAACDFNGFFGGVPRLPRLSLTAEDRALVERVFRHIRN